MFLMGAIRPIAITEQRKAVSTTQEAVDTEGGITLQPGQQLIRTVHADKFTMRTVVISEKNCVLTSQQVDWYDPTLNTERSRSQNEIFLTGGDDI